MQQMTMHTSKSMVEAQTHRSRMSYWLVIQFVVLPKLLHDLQFWP